MVSFLYASSLKLSGTHPSTMCINDKCKSIELAHRVNAGRANFGLAVFSIPQLEVATCPLGAGGSELELRSPLRLRNT